MPTPIEHGSPPASSPLLTRLRRAARTLTTPLLPDDYLELLDPRWSRREATGVVIEARAQTPTARTLVIRPSQPWAGHVPGQYLRLGVEIDGIRHWRAYTITSDPDHPLGLVSVTVQQVRGGHVSMHLNDPAHVGDRVFLGSTEGEFVLPSGPPQPLLMITGGCGITPILAMVRSLQRQGFPSDVVHLHVARTAGQFMFGERLRPLAAAHEQYHLVERHSETGGRLRRQELDALVPSWRSRHTYLSGPSEMMLDFQRHWDEHGDPALLHTERFQPTIGLTASGEGAGGTVAFRVSGLTATAEPGLSILVAGEAAGARLPYGCRMGICHSCIGRLQSGQVQDLRTGEVHGEPGQAVRTCVNAPAGDIELEL